MPALQFRISYNGKIISHFSDTMPVPLARSICLRLRHTVNPGGIDLGYVDEELEVLVSRAPFLLRVDPAVLQQYQNAAGFIPVIGNIRPMKDLQVFLGLKAQEEVSVAKEILFCSNEQEYYTLSLGKA